MLFSERKKLAEEYEKWISENKDVLDCPLTVISWLVAEGYVGKTKVADLEAKLAESEKQRQHLKDWLDDEILTSVDHESYNATINEYEEQIAELKQQLTEANKEIEYMNVSSDWQSLLILKQEMEILQTENKVLKRRNQDKISFAIEQLEWVQKLLLDNAFNELRVVLGEIDNQIKELKKEIK